MVAKWVSRPRIYQLRRNTEGCCSECGQPNGKGDAVFCDAHREAHRASCRKYSRKKAAGTVLRQKPRPRR